MMKAAPGTTLEVVEPEFLFELLVALLDGPALVGEPHQLRERGVRRQVGQVILEGVVSELLDQKPALDAGLAP